MNRQEAEEARRMYALGVNIAHLTGLTEWTQGTPPCPGWWNTRPRGGAIGLGERRWWDGRGYSWPVDPLAGFHPDEVTALMLRDSRYPPDYFEWRGIKAPPGVALPRT